MTKSLNKLVIEHQQLSFPSLDEDNEELSNWLTDLTEIDGYYIGLATSLGEGNSIELVSSQPLKKMHQRLETIKKHTTKSDDFFKSYQDYLSSLESLAKALERSTENIV